MPCASLYGLCVYLGSIHKKSKFFSHLSPTRTEFAPSKAVLPSESARLRKLFQEKLDKSVKSGTVGKRGEMRQERESRLEDCSIRQVSRRTGGPQSSWGAPRCSVDSTEFSLISIHRWLRAAPRSIPLRDKMGDIGQRHLSATLAGAGSGY